MKPCFAVMSGIVALLAFSGVEALGLADEQTPSLSKPQAEATDAKVTQEKLRNLLSADRYQQQSILANACNDLMQLGWRVRAAKFAAEAWYPFAKGISAPYPFTTDLHAAAVDLLNRSLAAEPSEAEGEAIASIGLSGSRRDIAFLKKVADRLGPSSKAVGALAKLGDPEAFNAIARVLRQKATVVPNTEVVLDHGRILPKRSPTVTTLESALALAEAMREAEFTMDRRFIPLIISHLDDPNCLWDGNYSTPNLRVTGLEVLSTLAFGRGDYFLRKQNWVDWAKKHPKEISSP